MEIVPDFKTGPITCREIVEDLFDAYTDNHIMTVLKTVRSEKKKEN